MFTAGILPFRENSHGRTGNRTWDLMISSQRIWPLDHEVGRDRKLQIKYTLLSVPLVFSWFRQFSIQYEFTKLTYSNIALLCGQFLTFCLHSQNKCHIYRISKRYFMISTIGALKRDVANETDDLISPSESHSNKPTCYSPFLIVKQKVN